MTDLTTRLVIDLRNDQLLRGLRASGVSVRQLSGDIDHSMRQSDRSVSRFARNARRELGGLNRITGGVFGNLKNEILAVGSAWAGLSILKDSAKLDKNLVRMTQTAGVARRETAKMRKVFFETQTANGVPVEQSRAAMDKMLQFGLSLDESLTSTRSIADASAVGHTDPALIAEALAVSSQAFGFDLSKDGIATDKLNKMLFAGDLGSAELEKLSSIMAHVGHSAKSAGMTFEGTLGFVEQLSMSQPNPEKLATLAESTLRIFTQGAYRDKVIDNLKIDFYKEDGSSRNPYTIFDDIAKIYQLQPTKKRKDALISEVFDITDKDTKAGMNALLSGNSLKDMRDKRQKITSQSEGIIATRLPDSIDNAYDQMSRLKGTLRESIDGIAMPINKAVSGAIQFAIDPKKAGGMGWDGTDLLAGGGMGLAALIASVKLAKKLPGAGGLLGGVAIGEVLEQSVGVTPVYVVNMPSTFGIPGGSGKGKGAPSVVPTGSNNNRTPRLPPPNNGPRLNSGALGSMYQGMNQMGWRGLATRAAGFLGPLVAAGAVGFTIGDLVNSGFSASDKHLGTSIKANESDGFLKMMAFFGSETARQTVAIEKTINQTPAKVNLNIKIEDKTGRAKVDNIFSPDADVDFDISGGSMVAP